MNIVDNFKVIEGTIPIFHCMAQGLINPGPIHSFCNPDFMCNMDVNVERLPYELKVSTLTSD